MNLKSSWLAPVSRSLLRIALACAVCAPALNAIADANSLRDRYGELRQQLASNNFHRPLFIDSAQVGDVLRGDVYAVLDHRFDEVSSALKDPADWCHILILPFNTKYCRPSGADGSAVLDVRIGRKFDQPVRDAYRLQFALRPVAALPDYFESRLSADAGPLGTRDYRIAVAAVPIEGGRTFLHLSYSYFYGVAGRIAMQAYLSTVGADKVGFTVTGRDGNGAPIYIGGVRGAIERTAMRYYLAVDAHLSSRRAPPDQQLEKRIEAWFDATERYPRQLHEMDRPAYLAMKRGETERQQAMVE